MSDRFKWQTEDESKCVEPLVPEIQLSPAMDVAEVRHQQPYAAAGDSEVPLVFREQTAACIRSGEGWA